MPEDIAVVLIDMLQATKNDKLTIVDSNNIVRGAIAILEQYVGEEE